MIPWPRFLPLPTQTYSGASDPHLVVNQFEVGFRQRRMYSQDEDMLKVSWQMTQLQFDVFRYFVREELSGGSLAFETSILGLDGVEVSEVYLREGKFAFTTNAPGYVMVSAELIRVQATTMDAEIFTLLENEAFSSPEGFYGLAIGLFQYIEYHYGTGTL